MTRNIFPFINPVKNVLVEIFSLRNPFSMWNQILQRFYNVYAPRKKSKTYFYVCTIFIIPIFIRKPLVTFFSGFIWFDSAQNPAIFPPKFWFHNSASVSEVMDNFIVAPRNIVWKKSNPRGEIFLSSAASVCRTNEIKVSNSLAIIIFDFRKRTKQLSKKWFPLFFPGRWVSPVLKEMIPS